MSRMMSFFLRWPLLLPSRILNLTSSVGTATFNCSTTCSALLSLITNLFCFLSLQVRLAGQVSGEGSRYCWIARFNFDPNLPFVKASPSFLNMNKLILKYILVCYSQLPNIQSRIRLHDEVSFRFCFVPWLSFFVSNPGEKNMRDFFLLGIGAS